MTLPDTPNPDLEDAVDDDDAPPVPPPDDGVGERVAGLLLWSLLLWGIVVFFFLLDVVMEDGPRDPDRLTALAAFTCVTLLQTLAPLLRIRTCMRSSRVLPVENGRFAAAFVYSRWLFELHGNFL
jgi:hypothetical protein